MSVLFLALTLHTADSPDIIPESPFCARRLHLDWRKPGSLYASGQFFLTRCCPVEFLMVQEKRPTYRLEVI